MWVDARNSSSATSSSSSSPNAARAAGSSRSGWPAIKEKWVEVALAPSGHFNGVPRIASDRQITKLEEDKVSAYYGGGKLYS